jgi:ABC-type nitrate/sulfonate/bicarbonate transport system permease component
MKQLYNILMPAFTPFYDASKKTYTGIYIGWAIIFGLLWMNAPVLWPTPSEIGHQLWAYLGFNYNSSAPFVIDVSWFPTINFPIHFNDSGFYLEIFASLVLTITSMVISIAIACFLAYSSSTAAFKPIANIVASLRFMSMLGFLFLFMSLFHDSGKVKVVLLVYSIVSFFTLSLVTMMSRIPQREYDLWTTLRYSKWEQLYEIVIYGKADYIIEAISANFAIAWIMMTVAESKAMSGGGLGVLLFNADKYNKLILIFAIQIVIYVLGRLSSVGLQKLRYSLFPHTALAEKK